MILLDHVVGIATRPDLDAPPATMFDRQQTQSAVRGAVPIEVDLLRPGVSSMRQDNPGDRANLDQRRSYSGTKRSTQRMMVEWDTTIPCSAIIATRSR